MKRKDNNFLLKNSVQNIVFILIIGGAFWIVNSSKSIDVGIISFLGATRRLERFPLLRKIGVNNIVMSLIIILFSLFGGVFGMSEETLAFVVVLVPLAISMGYDSIVGVSLVYVAAHVGFAGAFLNPFTVGVAQNMADIPMFSGVLFRLLVFAVVYAVLAGFFISYAPYDDPEIAVAVVGENVKTGGGMSTVAVEVYNYYFGQRTKYESMNKNNVLIP